MVLGIAICAVGVVCMKNAISPRAEWVEAIDAYRSRAYPRTDSNELDTAYNGHPVALAGKLSYDEGGASDPVFDVHADSAMLVRVSEMYQWTEDGDGGYTGVWSEELLFGGDGHPNPASYPANMKSGFYSAHDVKIGGLKVSDEQLSQLTTRERITSLPDVDVRGYRTVGEYVTNAGSLDSPEIGDVRIHFEYMVADTITVAGMQRSGGIVDWRSPNELWFSYVFEGRLTVAETASRLYHVDVAGKVVWWMLIVGIAVTLAGPIAVVYGYASLTRYKPMLKFGKKSKSGRSVDGAPAILLHGLIIGAISAAIAAAASWSGVSSLWLMISLAVGAVYLYVAVIDLFKRTPRRVKVEAEYKPILVKKDEFKRK